MFSGPFESRALDYHSGYPLGRVILSWYDLETLLKELE